MSPSNAFTDPPHRRSDRVSPLSFGQQALWFLDRLAPESPTYNVAWVYRLSGPLRSGLLEQALHDIVRRHDVLRSVFPASHGEPRVHIVAWTDFCLVVDELDDTTPAENDTTVQETVRREALRPFDLEHGPLVRARLLRTAPDESVLIVVFHHIAWDEESRRIFETELCELYAAAAAARPPKLADLGTQYDDYAREQRRLVDSDAAHDQPAYWRDQLARAPEPLELPSDRSRPAKPTFTGATASFRLPSAVVRGVRHLAREEGTTAFVILLTAFTTFLHRYTGRSDIIVGTPVSTRTSADLEALIGYFVNILPIRTKVRGRDTFVSHLSGVRETLLDALDHRVVPFEVLVERLREGRPAGHSPLQVVFGMHPESARCLRLGEVTATRGLFPTGTSKFDMTWSIYDDGAELRLEVEFNTVLFDVETVRRMAGHWQHFLRSAVARPATVVADLDILTTADRRTVLPSRRVPQDIGRCLHQRFEEAAVAHAARIAVSRDGNRLTYAELNASANRLARWLRGAGIEPGDRVGLLLDRDLDAVVAILGVLKAGAAYVPVEPDSPAERTATFFADAGVRAVVTDRDNEVPSGDWIRVHLGHDAARIAACPGTDLDLALSTDRAAYVIFTSGSTGRPKGVEVRHRSVLELFEVGSRRFEIAADDVWTMFHSYAFDFSVWEMWGALLHGGRLVVVPFSVTRDPEAFAGLLEDEAVTVLNQTPSAFGQLTTVLEEAPRDLDRLRWIVTGGEALRPEHAQRWFALRPPPAARLCNMYGITETTVHVTAHDVEPSGETFQRSVIGRPLPHLTCSVLDAYGCPVPVGVPGELYVGGGGLAVGYLGRPRLTADRFRPEPHAATPGSRLYRTGDLVRWLPDGNLEFLGRTDDQVKIRGHRVEPGEVQAALARHPGVRECVVVARPDTTGGDRLVAYLVPSDPRPGANELREFLALTLPAYLLPAATVLLDVLPLNVNGKLDRHALPEPNVDRAGPDATYTAPGTPAEQALAEIWADVLGLDRVGRHDNFFALGGDSIRSVRVAAAAKERGWELRVDSIFANPTVAQLAADLPPREPGTGRQDPGSFALLTERDISRLPDHVVNAYPMTSMQLAMVYHQEHDPVGRPYLNVNSYRVVSPLDQTAFVRAVADAVDRHPVLRTSFDLATFSEPMQLVHPAAPAPVGFRDIQEASEADQQERIADLVRRERSTPFPLDKAPLLRIHVHRLSGTAFQLTLAEHHAILDGWSFTSLVAEILVRHARLRENPEQPPAARPDSTFGDFVGLERLAMSSTDSLAYWRQKLVSADGALPDADISTRHAGRSVLEQEIPVMLCHRIAEFAKTARVSRKSVVLAAHVVALADLLETEEITTALTFNGRPEQAAGTDVLGLFLNAIPLHVRLDGGSWISLVEHLHNEEAEMMPHRRVPFAQLSRFMARPRMDIGFVFNRFDALAHLPEQGVRILGGQIESEPALRDEPNHFHLSVGVMQDPVSERALLAVSHNVGMVPSKTAGRLPATFVAALEAMTRNPDADYRMSRRGD